MRVTAKVRKVRSNRQGRHYIFTSEVHHADELAANERRAAIYAKVGTIEPVKKKPFPKAADVSSVGVRMESPLGLSCEVGFKLATEEEFLEVIDKARQPSEGIYFVPHASKVKKDGSPVMQKRKAEAFQDSYFSMPPWYAEFFALFLDSYPEKAVAVQESAFKAASAAARALEQRTGYEAVSLAVHPDSRKGLGFHIQFRRVRDGELLGRSACGERGRKGLRLAGDVNLALYRFDAVESVPGSWKRVVEERDYDDVAMEADLLAALDREVVELAGEAGLELVADLAKDHVRNWKKREDVAGRIEQAEMKGRLSKVEEKLGRVSKALRGFDEPDSPEI